MRRAADKEAMRVVNGSAQRTPDARTPSRPALGTLEALARPTLAPGGSAEDRARAQVGAPLARAARTDSTAAPAGTTVRNLSGLRADDGKDPAKAKGLGEWIKRMGSFGLIAAMALLSACSTVSGPAGAGGGARPGVVQVSDASRPVSHAQVFRATRGMSTTEKVSYYQQLLSERGYSPRLDDSGRATIVGLRTPTATTANHGNGAYDDGFAVLRRLTDGTVVCQEYVGNTEPCGNTRGAYGVDIDGDGRRDLGCLVPGKLELCFSTSDGKGEVLRPTGTAYVTRDVDWDGDFDEGGRHSAGRSVLFHMGGDGYTSSAACQTLPPSEWPAFMDTLSQGRRPGTIDYFLLVR